MISVNDITWAFTGKDDLKRSVVDVLNQNIGLMGGASTFNTKMSWAMAMGIAKGKTLQTFNKASSNLEDTVVNLTRYEEGESKEESSDKKFKNFNAYTTYHEGFIFDRIKERANGDMAKFIRELDKMNKLLEKHEYSYNILKYAYYEIQGG